jgi:hypothetical protein
MSIFDWRLRTRYRAFILREKIRIVKRKDQQSGDNGQGWSVKGMVRAEITRSNNSQGEVSKLGEA